MENNWFQDGADFRLQELSKVIGKVLPKGIYQMKEDIFHQIYLQRVGEKFEFPYTVYGIQSSFIKRVINTYKATTGNLGILLNGLKGTGKTVTAEMICNELNLPVILVGDAYGGLPDFISKMENDVIIFIDEYEKIFKGKDEDGNWESRDEYLLSVMDGSLNNEFRKVFMLTTNNIYVNDNLIQRPGRLRYIKKFSHLPLETIIEIVDHRLEHKEFREKTIKFISELEMITVDIVKAVIEEVNIHKEEPEVFKEVFNINVLDKCFNILVKKDNKWEDLYTRAKTGFKTLRKSMEGSCLSINGEHPIRVNKVYSTTEFSGFFVDPDYLPSDWEDDYLEDEEEEESGTTKGTVDEDLLKALWNKRSKGKQSKPKVYRFKLEETYSIHASFNDYAF